MKAALQHPQALFPAPWFQMAVVPIPSDAHAAMQSLPASEQHVVRDAVASRQASFAMGRHCARQALSRLGVPMPAHLLPDAHGCPRWPQGVVGSISHSPMLAMAVTARRSAAQALGVDIESPHRDVSVDALTRVFDPQEIAWLAGQKSSDRRFLAYALFSCREALYKCVFQASGHRLAPHEVRVQLDMAQGLFRARWLARARSLFLPVLTGRVGCDAQHVFAGVWCPPMPQPSSSSQLAQASQGTSIATSTATAKEPDHDPAHLLVRA
jgi:4'-phosphopantetheinyl transferase EntD